MTDDQRPWVLTQRVIKGVDPYPGSDVRWCFICAAEVWLSPKGLESMERNSGRPLCMECGIPMMANDHGTLNPVDPDAPEAHGLTGEIVKLIREYRKQQR